MNIGFYLDSIANEEELKTVATEISKHNLRDANIFYNEIGKINIPLTCGLFHCADMWSFEGTLIVSSVKNLVKACSKNVKIIQISTDYVFDGAKGPYYENDPTYPINYYGRSKLEAENFLKGSLVDYTIIRASVLYGSQLNEKPNFFSWVYNSLKSNTPINVVTDQVSNPVWLQTFIDTILNAIIYKAIGIYHLGSDDYLSRYEFAVLIAKTFNLNQDLINPVDSESVPFLANRPQNSGLKTDKIVTELNVKTLSTSDSLNFIKHNINII